MGRPIKKRFFVRGGGATPTDVVQYEGVTVSINNTGSHYSLGATASVSAPQDAAGVTATVVLTVTTTTNVGGGYGGFISAATIANPGSGYNANPTVTVVAPATQTATVTTSSTATITLNGVNGIYVGMQASGTGINASTTYVTAVNVGTNTVTLSRNNQAGSLIGNVITFSDVGASATFTVGLTHVETDTNTIACTAYLTTGSSAVSSAIIKQEAAHRYLVENNQGRGTCKLSTATVLTAGLMTITAKDTSNNVYFVTKLTSKKARLWQKSGSGYLFNNGQTVHWVTGTNVVSTLVSIVLN